MDQLFMDLEKLTSISEQEDYLHIASENGDKIIRTGIFTNIIKEAIIGATPSYYARGSLFTPAKTTITIHADTQVNINGKGYSNAADVVLNTSEVAQAGKDVYIYACVPESGNEPEFVLSRNSTVPDGYDADNSRKIGGFHCLCADVGIISGHPLSGYVAGDILPASVWDLKHRPVSEPEGMVYVEGLGKWYDIYLASWDGAKLVSAYGGTIADGASARKYHGLKFNEDFGRIGKHLPSWDEFMVFAKGSNEQTSISGAADPGTTGGHRDTAGRRMISNDGLEDCVERYGSGCTIHLMSHQLTAMRHIRPATDTSTIMYLPVPKRILWETLRQIRTGISSRCMSRMWTKEVTVGRTTLSWFVSWRAALGAMLRCAGPGRRVRMASGRTWMRASAVGVRRSRELRRNAVVPLSRRSRSAEWAIGADARITRSCSP